MHGVKCTPFILIVNRVKYYNTWLKLFNWRSYRSNNERIRVVIQQQTSDGRGPATGVHERCVPTLCRRIQITVARISLHEWVLVQLIQRGECSPLVHLILNVHRRAVMDQHGSRVFVLIVHRPHEGCATELKHKVQSRDL